MDALLNYKIESSRLGSKYEEVLVLNIELVKAAEELYYHKGIILEYLQIGGLLYESGRQEGEMYEYLVKYSWFIEGMSKRTEKKGDVNISQFSKQQNEKYQKVVPLLNYVPWAMVILCMMILFFVSIHYEKKRKESKRLILEKDMMIRQKEMESNELRKKLNAAFKEVVSLAKDNDPSFLARFQEVYPEVCTKLLTINPKLVNTELSLCAMIWLNFSSKEIAQYTFVQPKTVQIKKYRLRKKLGIPSDENLYSWIRS
ncbi:LuxR C-terminal-related transcriptional regulator [Galbibacter sp. EGI 63066]|uniref:helix-turn-helix transcriptional regulator n=1 Tax=Galbibacter sp. EGI 63066 TaxID=2993559 RepID=UPI0022492C16|nr:LuxR C-terminal-related transcriptional regulator [Galbibacter sp. EGI 63066]MCX2678357.1 LuxR C-terminal-related transcriptional regulator [Galbibacter sp. EGI 63066]